MRLNPRYGTDPVITLDGRGADVLEPLVRQRRRLAAALGGFSDEQWAHPSRCEGWTNRDVIVHLESTNQFWSYSIASGLAGEPTRFLVGFDPVASPAELVAGAGDVDTGALLDRFVASTAALTTLLASLDDDDWSKLAEAPPGHLTVSAVTHHALWDSWVHERDVLVPLGIEPDREDDEIAACLRWVAGIGPALSGIGDRHGVLTISATHPDLAVVVEIGDRIAVRNGTAAADADLHLEGDARDLVESLSLRAPLPAAVPDTSAWMLRGLAQAFDAEPA